MNGAIIVVGSRLGKGIGKLFVRIHSFGFENLVGAHDVVGHIVTVAPGDGGPRIHRERLWGEVEVVDLYHVSRRVLFGWGGGRGVRARSESHTLLFALSKSAD